MPQAGNRPRDAPRAPAHTGAVLDTGSGSPTPWWASSSPSGNGFDACTYRRRGTRVICHQEGGARNADLGLTARTLRVHAAARGAFEIRERRLAVWAGAERCMCHLSSSLVRLG